MGLDISLLETYILVSDLGSFSAAARRLGLTQPAVSLQIKSLEKELGAPLIDRSRGKVVLTPAGHTAYGHARKILADRERMMADIPRSTGLVAGRLLLGASTVPGEFLLPALLADFRMVYPDVSIRLEIHDSQGVIDALREERIELGFTGSRPEGDLSGRKFAEDRLVLVTPSHHPLSGRRKVTLPAIARERFVDRRAGSGTRKRLEAALEEKGLSRESLEVVAELGSSQSVISAVRAGMGISVVSHRAAEQWARAGLISMIEVSGVDLSRDFYAVFNGGRPMSLAAASFLETACDSG